LPRTFLQQRFFPSLRLGLTPTVSRAKRGSSPFHCRQGEWDGACGLHCAVMALALLGRIATVKAFSKQRRGISARLWQTAQGTYFDGMSTDDMVAAMLSLDADLHVKQMDGRHREILDFTRSELAAGKLVIVGWRNPERTVDHWVLAIGVEGIQSGRTFTPHTLLVMDPSLGEPVMCGYNGRLQFTSHPLPHKSMYITYLGNDGTDLAVTLNAAVAIGSAT
jgi:hypothetical protein